MLSRTYARPQHEADAIAVAVQLVAAGASGRGRDGRFHSAWGCVLTYKTRKKSLQGDASPTSAVRMELTGIVRGLKQLKCPCAVTVHTCSEYIADTAHKLFYANRHGAIGDAIYGVPP